MGLDVAELNDDPPDAWAIIERLDRLDETLRRIEELLRGRMPTVMPEFLPPVDSRERSLLGGRQWD